jgi:hypothetical protein
MKEQQTRIEQLATRNNEQQTEIGALRAEIKQISQTVKRLAAS